MTQTTKDKLLGAIYVAVTLAAAALRAWGF
jgi:hypothetical protein